jgi:hypothetical protein
MSEVWDPVFWNPVLSNLKYEVSNHGEVRVKETGRILPKQHYGGRSPDDRYWGVSLDGHSFMVHKLVLENFLANPLKKPEGNHKNGIKKDNRLLNLEWATGSENVQHAYDTKLRLPSKKAIRQLSIDGVEIAIHASEKEAAIMTNGNSGNISNAAVGRSNVSGGFRWEFVSNDHKTDRIRPVLKGGGYVHKQTPIQQMDQEGVVLATYPCLKDAAAAMNVNRGNISRAALGRVVTSGGYRWAYINKS